jgi:predicted Zn-dependent protease
LQQALALERCPRKDCLHQLGLALASLGRHEEARKVMAELELMALEEAVARDRFPSNPAMRVQIAEAMLAAGKLEEARAVLEKVLAEEPDLPAAHRVLALYFAQKGQTGRAEEHRRKATR